MLDNGFVGIGTTSPDALLDIAGTGVPIEIDSTNSNAFKMQFKDAGSAVAFLGASADTFFFGNASAAQLARIDSDGIKFGTDSAAANGLGDYEEGTWTPRYIATSANPTVSYGNQIGRYVKVGQIVSASFRINISSVSGGSGSLFIAGLPYASETVSSMFSTLCVGYSDGWGTVAPQSGFLTNGGTSMQILRNNGTDAYSELDSSVSVSHMGGICDIVGHLTYRSA